MYYNNLNDYVGDKINVMSKDGWIYRKLSKKLQVSFRGQMRDVELRRNVFVIK